MPEVGHAEQERGDGEEPRPQLRITSNPPEQLVAERERPGGNYRALVASVGQAIEMLQLHMVWLYM